MTEAEWLACPEPTRMLEFLRGTASSRKVRRLGCVSSRMVWHLTPPAPWQVVVRPDGSHSNDAGDFANLTHADPQSCTQLVDVIRCIFGNPFRPVAVDPAWRTDTVVALARQMYESRDFGAMPILADALQDAGCTNEDVLSHCRGPGPHVRGCWVVDLVLGKQ
jgi:hypothetical protein